MSWLTGIVSWFKSLFAPSVSPQIVTKVQAATVKACGFLPMAESVVNLVATGNPAVLTVSAIASSICAVVTKLPPTTGMVLATSDITGASPPVTTPPTWTINGVPIHGEFVK